MAVAGKAAMTVEGAWDAAKEYDRLCLVSYNNKVYISRKKPPIGEAPVEGDYWMLMIEEMTEEELETALLNKQDKITGGASSITNTNLTAAKVLVSDANGKVASSEVSETQLNYIKNVTSDVQNQINKHEHAAESLTGGTLGGTVVAPASTNYNAQEIRNIVVMEDDPGEGASVAYNNGTIIFAKG